LSCRSELADKIECLNMGADDYITKPFEIAELVARIQAVLRRSQPDKFVSSLSCFKQGAVEIDFVHKQVMVHGQEIKLTPTEFRLLQELVLNEGKCVSYDILLSRVWGSKYQHEREYLHVYVGRLRRKIKPELEQPEYFINVHGSGYLLSIT
jgi:two-component system KDP operon response regulator KdpE